MDLFCIIGIMEHARIQEVFSSIQGEGPWIGQRHIFVRFAGCDIQCRYCDTPAAAQSIQDGAERHTCSVQRAAGSNDREQEPNPVTHRSLTAFCSRLIIPGPARPVISLTGGEPLLQAPFLAEWLPTVRGTFDVYLETSGIHSESMERIRDLVDSVSIDLKLPSATGLRPFWDEHGKFLHAAREKTLYVKAVVTGDTTEVDILSAAGIVANFDRSTIFVLQPAGGALAPDAALLIRFQDVALGILSDVRVIPQAHKILNMP
jgi:7-carboxy-7-deazaguanine synthase